MPILMTAVVPGLDAAGYDQMLAAGIGETLGSAPGLRAHVAYPGERGWTVVEIWESEADWREHFDTYIKDQLPPDATEDWIELHNALLP